jgi:hypothetical protein
MHLENRPYQNHFLPIGEIKSFKVFTVDFRSWDRCCDLKNIFSKNLAKKSGGFFLKLLQAFARIVS